MLPFALPTFFDMNPVFFFSPNLRLEALPVVFLCVRVHVLFDHALFTLKRLGLFPFPVPDRLEINKKVSVYRNVYE